MPRIIFRLPDGATREIEAPSGESVMRAAVVNNVPGIVADCGGNCSCATCHGIIDEVWAGRLAPPTELEDSLLDFVLERGPTSRLTCQIRMEEDLAGLVVQIPGSQT